MRTGKAHLLKAIAGDSATTTCAWQRLKGKKMSGKLHSRIKGVASVNAPNKGCWCGEAVGGLTRIGVSCMSVWGAVYICILWLVCN